MVGALGAEPVGLSKRAIEVARIERARQGSELVDDHLWLGTDDRVVDCLRIKTVEHHRGNACCPQAVSFGGGSSCADDLVPGNEQQSC